MEVQKRRHDSLTVEHSALVFDAKARKGRTILEEAARVSGFTL